MTTAMKITAFANRFRPVLIGTHNKQAIVLDNRIIRKAVLRNCTLFYGGGQLNISDVEMESCRFAFFGSAGNMLELMKILDVTSPEMIGKTFPGSILFDRINA